MRESRCAEPGSSIASCAATLKLTSKATEDVAEASPTELS